MIARLNLPEDPGPLAHAYRLNPIVFLPGVMSGVDADALIVRMAKLPGRRVYVGQERSSTWTSHGLAPRHRIHRLMSDETVVAIVHAIGGFPSAARLTRSQCWTHTYTGGEHIGPHRDVAGDIQMIVCLAAPPSGGGGDLVVETRHGRRALSLAKGDAVIFNARELEHHTTPMSPLCAAAERKRVTLVTRYYF